MLALLKVMVVATGIVVMRKLFLYFSVPSECTVPCRALLLLDSLTLCTLSHTLYSPFIVWTDMCRSHFLHIYISLGWLFRVVGFGVMHIVSVFKSVKKERLFLSLYKGFNLEEFYKGTLNSWPPLERRTGRISEVSRLNFRCSVSSVLSQCQCCIINPLPLSSDKGRK